MKRKIIIIFNSILILVAIKILGNIVINRILINKYNNGQYIESYAKVLTSINFIQDYVAEYNYGNVLYQKGEYQKAIEKYQKSLLNKNIPKYKECRIRINCALAMCKTVNVNEQEQDSIDEAIKTYESAINVLTDKGCANKNDNKGHNQDAEQLKEDIQKEIDRLKKLQKSTDNKKDDDEKRGTEDEEKTIEEKIQNIKEEATKDQRETENLYKNFNKDFNRTEKNW